MFQVIQFFAADANEFARIGAGANGDGQSDENPGDGGMDAGRQHRQPDAQREQEIDFDAAHLEFIGDANEREQDGGDAKTEEIQVGRIKQRNHQHRAEIVRNGERGQKNFETGRRSAAQQRENAERKCNVGCHRDAPAAFGRRSRVEQ
ncbi:MAG: hypothetical protein HDKAJFGB_03582 [Anaerolineae bacterium]|nr:hypothetical protein [Anaerolineae bacterium]